MRLHLFIFSFLLLLAGLLSAGGCATAVSAGQNTALDGTDLVKMTDDMSAKIMASPAVQRQYAEHGPLKVVVMAVENQMRAEILPRGPAEAFTARLRNLLSKHTPTQFTWIMNRDAFYRLRNSELPVDLGPSPDAINPTHALTARFSSLASEDATHRDSYYLCVYELTNLTDRTILWTGSYEVKKTAVKGMFD